MGIVLIAVLVPLNLLLRQRPEDLGLMPDGAVSSPTADGRPANIVDPVWTAVDWTLPRAMRTARFWWIALAFFCALFAWYAVQVHQTKYLVEIGFDPLEAAWALGLVSLLAIPGQIALGHLSDRIGREWVWTVGNFGFVICFLVLLLMQHAPTPLLLYLMVGSQGMLGYGLTSVLGAIPAEIFIGRHYGSIFGTLMLASMLGGAAGPWVTGLLHDATASYAPAFSIATGLCLLSAVAIWLAAPRKVRAVAGRFFRPADILLEAQSRHRRVRNARDRSDILLYRLMQIQISDDEHGPDHSSLLLFGRERWADSRDCGSLDPDRCRVGPCKLRQRRILAQSGNQGGSVLGCHEHPACDTVHVSTRSNIVRIRAGHEGYGGLVDLDGGAVECVYDDHNCPSGS
jgi:hypothetical protein